MEDFTLVWHDAKKEKPEYYKLVIVVNRYNDFTVGFYGKKDSDDDGRWYLQQGLGKNLTYYPFEDDDILRGVCNLAYWAYLPRKAMNLFRDEKGD